jgi:hypothetical protein
MLLAARKKSLVGTYRTPLFLEMGWGIVDDGGAVCIVDFINASKFYLKSRKLKDGLYFVNQITH